MDRNNDGAMTVDDLITVIRAIGESPNHSEFQGVIHDVDTDRNAIIDFIEFLALMSCQMRQNDIEEDSKDPFRLFNGDNDDFIKSQELRR
jgi:calmodulin